MINGERRRVRVRKNRKTGNQQVHVVYPKRKSIPLTKKSENLQGITKARHLNAQRTKLAQSVDKKQTSKKTVRPTKKNIETWRKNPGRMDIRHVDTKA
jgi:hypothetical protein